MKDKRVLLGAEVEVSDSLVSQVESFEGESRRNKFKLTSSRSSDV